jgi:toxin-antitoxin system PIN domain toxin
VKPALLDANLLIALLWPAHEHHDFAHAWFEGRREQRWATCPLTELAFVRIVSNPAFSKEALSPAEALALLGRNLSHAGHQLWPDEVGVVEALQRSAGNLQGHRQLTDL